MRWRCALTVAACCWLVAGCTVGNRTASAGRTSAAGSDRVGVTSYLPQQRVSVPSISGTTLQHGALSLRQFAGRVVVLNVWASWCDPCRAESPALAALAKSAGPDVQFIGLDESDGRSAAVKFVASVGAGYPELVDADGALLGRLKLLPTKGIPSTLVIDAGQRMAGRVVGPVTSAQLTALIAQARLGSG